MNKALVILSGKLVEHSLRAEFGEIYPVELPIRNRCLLEHQIEGFLKVNEGGTVFLVGHPSLNERIKPLKKRDVQYIELDEEKSLMGVWRLLAFEDRIPERFQVLYGDTLVPFQSLKDESWIGVGQDDHEDYDYLHVEGGVVCGYFCISKGELQNILSKIDCNSGFQDLISAAGESGISFKSVNNWLDFGNRSAYLRSKRSFFETRSFNELRLSRGIITKLSRDSFKLFSEYSWLQAVRSYSSWAPVPFVVNFSLTRNGASYGMEYLPMNSLADLFVFGNLSSSFQNKLLRKCFSVLDEFPKIQNQDNVRDEAMKGLFHGKLTQRKPEILRIFKEHSSGFDLEGVLEETIAFWTSHRGFEVVLMHGDFCFSNLLWDPSRQAIFCIDPRGSYDSTEFSILGFREYDELKLAHSYVAGYDLAIAGQSVDLSQHVLFCRLERFKEYSCLESADLKYGLLSLFLSMTPLHRDSPERISQFLRIIEQIYGASIN